jgi:hypothetical protein
VGTSEDALVGKHWCLPVVLFLAAAPPVAAVGPAEKAGPPPSVARLLEQLGDSDYQIRETASRQLRGLGPDVLPQLRAARDGADPEVRRRLDELITRFETEQTLAPKRITLDAHNKPVRQIFQEITRQTGYKIEFFTANEQQTYSFHFDRVPFWEAMDQIGRASGLVYQAGYGDDAVHFHATESYVPYVCYDGAFRLVANGFQQNRSIDFSSLPRVPAGPRRSESLVCTFSICAEPKLPLLGAGEPRLEAAYDDEHNSLVPPRNGPGGSGAVNRVVTRYGNGFRSFSHQMQFALTRPSEKATAVKSLKGSVPVTLLVSEKPELVTDKLMEAKGKKFTAGSATFAVEEATALPQNQYQVRMSITDDSRDTADNDYTWQNSLYYRLDVEDEKGNKFQPFRSNWLNSSPRHVQIEFTYGAPGNQKLGPPTKLVYRSWTTMQTQLTFAFKDLPLP